MTAHSEIRESREREEAINAIFGIADTAIAPVGSFSDSDNGFVWVTSNSYRRVNELHAICGIPENVRIEGGQSSYESMQGVGLFLSGVGPAEMSGGFRPRETFLSYTLRTHPSRLKPNAEPARMFCWHDNILLTFEKGNARYWLEDAHGDRKLRIADISEVAAQLYDAGRKGQEIEVYGEIMWKQFRAVQCRIINHGDGDARDRYNYFCTKRY